MALLFQGPVELAETKTIQHSSQYIGRILNLVFRVSKDNSNPNENVFPSVSITVSHIGTWHPWQQHEIWLNNHLIGTINSKDKLQQKLTFPFQPKILKIDTSSNLWDVAQENINELKVKLGSGGFGLNDSFDIHSIELNNIEL